MPVFLVTCRMSFAALFVFARKRYTRLLVHIFYDRRLMLLRMRITPTQSPPTLSIEGGNADASTSPRVPRVTSLLPRSGSMECVITDARLRRLFEPYVAHPESTPFLAEVSTLCLYVAHIFVPVIT
jgi:hypothetical protein